MNGVSAEKECTFQRKKNVRFVEKKMFVLAEKRMFVLAEKACFFVESNGWICYNTGKNNYFSRA